MNLWLFDKAELRPEGNQRATVETCHLPFTVLGMLFLVLVVFLVLFIFTGGGLQKTVSFSQAHTKSRDVQGLGDFWVFLKLGDFPKWRVFPLRQPQKGHPPPSICNMSYVPLAFKELDLDIYIFSRYLEFP